MFDIGNILVDIMQESNCSSVYALVALTEENKDVPVFQPESGRTLCRRLCTEGNIHADEAELGRYLH